LSNSSIGNFFFPLKNRKARWERVGILMDKDGKLSVKIDLIPVGSWDGWLVVSERKEREGAF